LVFVFTPHTLQCTSSFVATTTIFDTYILHIIFEKEGLLD
jgi:hypothetical protein